MLVYWLQTWSDDNLTPPLQILPPSKFRSKQIDNFTIWTWNTSRRVIILRFQTWSKLFSSSYSVTRYQWKFWFSIWPFCPNCDNVTYDKLCLGKIQDLFKVSGTLCNYYSNVYCLGTVFLFCYFTICKIKCAALIKLKEFGLHPNGSTL